jgi:hypothetical protein
VLIQAATPSIADNAASLAKPSRSAKAAFVKTAAKTPISVFAKALVSISNKIPNIAARATTHVHKAAFANKASVAVHKAKTPAKTVVPICKAIPRIAALVERLAPPMNTAYKANAPVVTLLPPLPAGAPAAIPHKPAATMLVRTPKATPPTVALVIRPVQAGAFASKAAASFPVLPLDRRVARSA